VLSFIRDEYGLFNNDAMLNMSMSVIFPVLIVCAAIGTWVEQRVGTSKLYVISMACLAISSCMLFLINSYAMYLVSRVIFAVGFAFVFPFVGSAIMRYYNPKQREIMNTVNGLFPWLGALLAYFLLVPMTEGMGGSWRNAIGSWGVVIVVVLAVWLVSIQGKRVVAKEYDDEAPPENAAPEKGIYRNLWKRREIKLLCGSFICDFFFYTYISTLLPLFLMEAANISEADAGAMAAFAFPVVGAVGACLGGYIASRSGKRRPIMLMGQLFKVAGVIVMVFAIESSLPLALTGVALFTLGNSSWLPAFYMVPMDLDDMTPSRAAGAFAMMNSAGFIFATISPMLGGWLTNVLAAVSEIADPIAAHVFGLKWSFFIFGFVNLIAFACVLALRETGPSGKR
jgi:CP family cyanate transporter-like MFS transporter